MCFFSGHWGSGLGQHSRRISTRVGGCDFARNLACAQKRLLPSSTVHYTKATKAETAAALRLWLHRYSQRRTPVVLYDTCEELQKGSRTSRQTLVVVHTLLASLDSKLSFSLDGKDEVNFFLKKRHGRQIIFLPNFWWTSDWLLTHPPKRPKYDLTSLKKNSSPLLVYDGNVSTTYLHVPNNQRPSASPCPSMYKATFEKCFPVSFLPPPYFIIRNYWLMAFMQSADITSPFGWIFHLSARYIQWGAVSK